jgi:hypothetical protein
MIYTCFEMVEDCRAGKAAGWNHLITTYVPVIRRLLAHYFPERAADAALIERVLLALREPGSSLYQKLDTAGERVFVCQLRQAVMAAVESDHASAAPALEIDLDTLQEALASLTATEREAVWYETMRYGAADVGRLLRMAPETVEKIRDRAAGLIRAQLDTWTRSLLTDNGPQLGRAAAALTTPDCDAPKVYTDMLDGRTMWRDREIAETHLTRCLHCVDHYCRMIEAADLIRNSPPLTEAEGASFRRLLGVELPAKPLWKRLIGA